MKQAMTDRYHVSTSAELLLMAFRNLSRHRVKTVLTVTALTVSVALYICVDGWLTGMNIDSIRAIVNYETGAAKLQSRDYFNDKDTLPMYENFGGWRDYAGALERAGYDSAPRFVFSGTLYSENGFVPVVINAVDPEREKNLLRYTDYIEDGRYIEAGAFEIVAGSLLAKKIIGGDGGSNPAALISTVIDIKEGGAIRHVNQIIPVVIVGVVNSPDPKVNSMAYIPLDVLQDEAGLMLDGAVTELLIRKQNPDDASLPGKDESAAAITIALEREAGLLPDALGIYTWKDYAQDYIAASNGDSVSSMVMLAILFVLSLLGIANTVMLATLERAKEIGMMRSLGMTDGELTLMMMFESGLTGLMGAAAGVLIGCLVNIPMVKYGIDFSAMTETMNGDIGYRLMGAFRSAWNIPAITGCAAAAVILSVCAAYLPVRRALKIPVTESLRFE
ncbi:MAG: FtsX-like permease family protein [Spirochaetaceae bacterium]|jgi:ABC-type lipoprotein release transport system permease subunit|nr:FtsX-like permease family protein [Spirochaetaceae bacterium]